MIIAFVLIVIHYIADFIFQTEDMAMNKSKDFNKLLKHTITYTILVSGLIIAYLKLINFELTLQIIFLFPLIIFVTHTIIDYFTSKIVSKKFKDKEFYTGIPNFGGAFSVIGFDQVLHYATLFLTYYFLTK